MLNKAYQISKKAHEGQFDKGGQPYYLHPLAVSEKVQSKDAKIVALLHDVIEDTSLTLEDLAKEGFSDTILTAIYTLTKQKGINYEDYMAKVKQNDLALVVKIADMNHNSDISRIPNPTEKDLQRVNKYKRMIKELSGLIK